MMVVDIETYDPNLLTAGPGVYRKDGYILGVGILSTEKNIRRYFAFKHDDITRAEAEKNAAIVYDLLASDEVKVTANGIYDFDWLINGYGFEVNGQWEDVISREALIYPYHYSYSLDNLSKHYGSDGKREGGLEQVLAKKGIDLKGKKVQQFFRFLSSKEIEEYALGDLDETLHVYLSQKAELDSRGLNRINKLECDLMPLLIKMKGHGVRVDENRRQQVLEQIQKEYDTGMKDFGRKYNCHGVNLNSGQELLRVFEREGLPIARTAKGNPQFNAETLAAIDHPIGQEILRLKGFKTVVNNFVDGSLKDFQVNGRIHPCHHPMKKDGGGTVTGRFSCTNPNTQQIPSKEAKRGDDIRSIFIPEEGCLWGAPDFSQIEYRILAHFATGPKSEELREEFRSNPKTDYHQLVVDMTGLDRKYAKNFNFGSIYFMGKKTMQAKFGFSAEQCDTLTEQYYSAMPFIVPTRDTMMATARRRGYLKTILGRHALLSDEMRTQKKEYKLVNYLIQGSAADIMKQSMVSIYQAGIFDVITPHLTVHDELGVSVPETRQGIQAYQELVYIMENCVQLDLPILVDNDIGPSWGEVAAADLSSYLERKGA